MGLSYYVWHSVYDHVLIIRLKINSIYKIHFNVYCNQRGGFPDSTYYTQQEMLLWLLLFNASWTRAGLIQCVHSGAQPFWPDQRTQLPSGTLAQSAIQDAHYYDYNYILYT